MRETSGLAQRHCPYHWAINEGSTPEAEVRWRGLTGCLAGLKPILTNNTVLKYRSCTGTGGVIVGTEVFLMRQLPP